MLPQSAEGKGKSITQTNVIRLLVTLLLLPLTQIICEDETAAFSEGMTECWPRRHRLSPGVPGGSQWLDDGHDLLGAISERDRQEKDSWTLKCAADVTAETPTLNRSHIFGHPESYSDGIQPCDLSRSAFLISTMASVSRSQYLSRALRMRALSASSAASKSIR